MKKRKKSSRRTSLRGLGGQVCFNTKKRGRVCFKAKKGVSGLRGLRDAETWAENKTKGCLKANLKLKKGWKFAKGGRCVAAGYFPSGSSRSVAPKAASKYPCIAKSGPKKGRLLKGWYIRGGQCRKAGSKATSTFVRVPGSGGYVNGLRGFGRVSYPCLAKSGAKKGKLKKGWYIRNHKCHRAAK